MIRGGWDPGAERDGSKPEKVMQCMGLKTWLHRLRLEPTHLLYPLATLGAYSPTVPTGYTWSLLT
jgi:hypothetical protein